MSSHHISFPGGDLEYQPSELRAAYRLFELHFTERIPFSEIALYVDAKPVDNVEGWMWVRLRAEEEFYA